MMVETDGPWSARYRGFCVGIERTLVGALECFSADSETPPSSTEVSRWGNSRDNYGGTYPGNFSVLFIEYAKCFPRDVKSNGR